MSVTEENGEIRPQDAEPALAFRELRELTEVELVLASGGKRCVFQWVEGDVVFVY
jgi:hypothetical protein